MLKFILLVFSVCTALIAAAHTVSFVMYGQLLLATITALYFVCGTFMAAALIQLEKTTPRSSSPVVSSGEHNGS